MNRYFQFQDCFAAAVLLFVSVACGSDKVPKFLVPENTFSPDHRYAVTVPVLDQSDDDINRLIEVRTGRVLAVINAETGYDRNINHRTTVPVRWAADSSLAVWQVDGKWRPMALVLLYLKNGRATRQLDMLKIAQRAILHQTRRAAPAEYAAVMKASAGKGFAYPGGFTIDVEVLDPISFPLHVRAFLTSNPKSLEEPPKLESHLDALVDQQGKFKITDFKLGYGQPPRW